MTDKLTHIDDTGAARMVDVGGKIPGKRVAVAGGTITMLPATLDAVREGNGPKGDVLGAARIAGIMAAKQTSTLIPLCHPLPLDAVSIHFDFNEGAITVTAKASTTGKTGVEMEALTATTIALLTIYDMAKALEKGMVISQVKLLEKRGGKSGDWRAAE